MPLDGGGVQRGGRVWFLVTVTLRWVVHYIGGGPTNPLHAEMSCKACFWQDGGTRLVGGFR